MYTKEQLTQALQQKVGTVVFTKADGSERTMRCTLHSSFIPAQPVKESTKPARVDNPNVVSVWDIEAEGWRSFKVDSIISTDL